MRSVLLALVLGCGAARAGAQAGEPSAADAWDAAFTRAGGWNGGDIGHSIDLGDGRTLWLFGDSIVGPVREGARAGGESKFVRGAVGWHETPTDGEAPGEVSFAIPEAFGGVPGAAWASPAPGLFEEGAWYWLMGDGEMVLDGAGRPRFVLFATAIGRAGNPEGMWDFRQVGGAVLTVGDTSGEPGGWEAVQRRNPLVGEAAGMEEEARETDNWGLAVVAWPPGGQAGAREMYVYGVRSRGPGDARLVVARCGEGELDAPGSWEFFDGDGWAARREDAGAVASGVVSEFTVDPVVVPGRDGGGPVLVLVQSEPMLGRRVLARTARSPEGPWSEPKPLFGVERAGKEPGLLTYAAKGHAALSREGELLVSYVINSSDFGRVFRDASLYRPRFVRVPLEMLPEAPE
jgi:hypothetical protein